MLQVSNLSKSYGTQTLFENASFQMGKGDHIGLVGRNGSGKSTLFKIIRQLEEASSGDISVPKNYKVASVDQHIKFTHPTVLSEALSALREDERHESYRAEKFLTGLGFSEEDFEKDPYSFSGGYQVRINLSKALLGEPDLLLLDEPTNYLDIVSLKWMKGFLRTFSGEFILITHDRTFMDSVVTHTLGIRRKSVRKVEGDTAKYYAQMVMEDEIYEKTRKNQENKVKEVTQFVDRFRAKASKSKQVQSRVKALEKMDVMGELSQEKMLGFQFHYQQCPGKFTLQVDQLACGYNEKLFSELSFALEKGENIGIIGKNGKGKSTLLNSIAGDLPLLAGGLKFHPSVQMSYFGQTNVDRLDARNTVISEIQESNPDLSFTNIRSICGAMLFEGDLAEKKISVLSGGEKARVLLGKILAKKANLILLDEPTNHLDMESVEVLIREVAAFEGSCLFVTHNEKMLRSLADRLIVFKTGGAELFWGGYDDFLKKVGWEEDEKGKKKAKLSFKEAKRMRSELIKERSKIIKPLEREYEKLETSIDSWEKRKSELEACLIELASTGSGEEISEMGKEIGKLDKDIENSFEKLEKVSEELEEKKSQFKMKLEELEN